MFEHLENHVLEGRHCVGRRTNDQHPLVDQSKITKRERRLRPHLDSLLDAPRDREQERTELFHDLVLPREEAELRQANDAVFANDGVLAGDRRAQMLKERVEYGMGGHVPRHALEYDGEYRDDAHLTHDYDRPRIHAPGLEGIVVLDVREYLRYRLEELRLLIVRGRHRLDTCLDEVIGRRETGEYAPHYRDEVTSAALLPVKLARARHVHELEANEVPTVLERRGLVLVHFVVRTVVVMERDQLVDVRVQEAAERG